MYSKIVRLFSWFQRWKKTKLSVGSEWWSLAPNPSFNPTTTIWLDVWCSRLLFIVPFIMNGWQTLTYWSCSKLSPYLPTLIYFFSILSSLLFFVPFYRCTVRENNCTNNQLIFQTSEPRENKIMFMSINNLFYIQCPPFVSRENKKKEWAELQRGLLPIQWMAFKIY